MKPVLQLSRFNPNLAQTLTELAENLTVVRKNVYSSKSTCTPIKKLLK